MKYQIFTVAFNDITAGAEVTSVSPRYAGGTASQPSLTVGTVPRFGPGRVYGMLGILPVEMPLADMTSKTRLFYASVKRDAGVRLVPEPYVTSFDFAIVKVAPCYGREWSVEYEGIDKFERLATGVLSNGALYPERPLWNEQYIVLAPRGEPFRITRVGESNRRSIEYTFVGDRITMRPVM